MKFVTNHPYVFVHGMYGFGKDDGLDKLMPYWGMLSGALIPYLKSEGFEVYNPSIGSFSSAWDRACELYAQLVGGTVDYGVAHSRKNNHKRYGRTYRTPLFEGWGDKKKINLFGHSFGAATIRLFAQLMAEGSKEEQEATPWEELSDLFKGGKGDWIHSVTSVAGVHEGTTLLYSMKSLMDPLRKGTYIFANAIGGTLINRFYQGQMEQFDLNGISAMGKETKAPKNKERQKAAAEGRDNVFYDLTLKGAKELNEWVKCQTDVYYFSFALDKTNQKFFTQKNIRSPRFTMTPLFWPMSRSMGKYKRNTVDNIPIDESWLANDGLVPTISAKAPFSDPQIDFYDANGKYKKGIWHVMDVLPMDHLGIVGGFLLPTNAAVLRKIYRDHMRVINSLK